MWTIAVKAYADIQGILNEFQDGMREVINYYDLKWIDSLKKRLTDQIDN